MTYIIKLDIINQNNFLIGDKMREHDIYKSMYLFLFNAVTDALADLPEDPELARTRLALAQIKCEKMFIDFGEDKS